MICSAAVAAHKLKGKMMEEKKRKIKLTERRVSLSNVIFQSLLAFSLFILSKLCFISFVTSMLLVVL